MLCCWQWVALPLLLAMGLPQQQGPCCSGILNGKAVQPALWAVRLQYYAIHTFMGVGPIEPNEVYLIVDIHRIASLLTFIGGFQ